MELGPVLPQLASTMNLRAAGVLRLLSHANIRMRRQISTICAKITARADALLIASRGKATSMSFFL